MLNAVYLMPFFFHIFNQRSIRKDKCKQLEERIHSGVQMILFMGSKQLADANHGLICQARPIICAGIQFHIVFIFEHFFHSDFVPKIYSKYLTILAYCLNMKNEQSANNQPKKIIAQILTLRWLDYCLDFGIFPASFRSV